jgi:hypothetical protein
MFTVIIVIILSIFITIWNSFNNPRVNRKYKLASAVRLFIFSGIAITTILFGALIGVLLAYSIGFFADGEYRKVDSILMSPIPIDGEEYHYIKKTIYNDNDTVVSFKFCFSDNSGDLNFYEYVVTKKGGEKKTLEKGRVVELHFCEVESCCFRGDMYDKISIKGWLKYFGFCSSFRKMKIYIPKDAKVKEVFI